ncbi:hypothetical protein B0H10DRAFT_1772481, partial [Mycena sp. CBHHK59/15]
LPISIRSTSLLFFYRFRAVYGGKCAITIIFRFLWFAAFASAVTIPFGGSGTPIGPNRSCIIVEIASYVGAAGITLAVHDTTVFLVIVSYRLVSNTHVEHASSQQVKALLSGAHLLAFSRAGRSGSAEFSPSAGSPSSATSMIYIPGITPVYHGMFAIPNITLTSIMACRVYCNAKLGSTPDSSNISLSFLVDGPVFASDHHTIPLGVRFSMQRSGHGDDTAGRDAPREHKGGVLMTKTTTVVDDHDSSFSSGRHRETV